VWARDQVVDEHAYVRTVAPLSSNPAIDAAVAAKLTNAFFSHVDVAAEAKRVLPARGDIFAVPLAVGLRDVTGQAIDRFLASPQFNKLWRLANEQAHVELVRVLEGKGPLQVATNGAVSIDLTGTALAVRGELDAEGIHVFDAIPASALRRDYVIGHSRWLKRARFVFELQAVAFVVPALAILCWALALGLSRRRRRTLRGIGAGVSVAAVIAIAATAVGRTLYLDHVIWPVVPRAAGAAFFDTVTRLPRLGLRLELLAGVLLLVGTILRGRPELVAKLSAPWLGPHKRDAEVGALLLAGVYLVASSHTTPRLLIVLSACVVAFVAIVELVARPQREQLE
jgi:hypothetical protein